MHIGSVTVQRARKRHRCWWCSEWIEPGEEYIRWCEVDADQFVVTKCHPECEQAWLDADLDGDEVYMGSFCRGCTCEHGCCECGKGTK